MNETDTSAVAELLVRPEAMPALAAGTRSSATRRAIAKLTSFFLVFGVVIFAFDRFVTAGLHRITTSKFGSLNRVVAGDINAEIVVNGSSRALTHYDPRILTAATGLSAYNLGMNGIQSDVQTAILETYLAHNRTPRLVIQNLEAFSFEATAAGEIYDPGAYLPYLDQPELYAALQQIDPAVWKWRHIPLYGYAVEDMRFTWVAGVLGWCGIQGREDYILGFNPRRAEWTGDFERYRATVPEGVRYRVEPRGVRALVKLLSACQARHIPVVLVYSPEYVEMQALERNRAEIVADFRALARRFGVEFWDFSDSPLCRDRSNFYNSQHLNDRGAEAFSIALGERLCASGVIKTPAGEQSRSTADPAQLNHGWTRIDTDAIGSK